jgi:DNA-binding NtrC family response regulator
MEAQSTILLVDDDLELADLLAERLRRAQLSVVTAASVPQAKSILEQQSFDVIVTDYDLKAEETGGDLLSWVAIHCEKAGRVVWSSSVLPDGIAAHACVDKAASETLLKVIRSFARLTQRRRST